MNALSYLQQLYGFRVICYYEFSYLVPSNHHITNQLILSLVRLVN